MSNDAALEPVTMSDGATLAVYKVQPTGKRKGAIVLIQEIFGLTPHIREQCDQLAAEGYEVWAPSLFDRAAPELQLEYSEQDIAQGMALLRAHPFELAVADAQTCIQALSDKGPVFITGYCYGGSVSWAVACRSNQVAGASCYYGSMIPALADEQPRAPIIAHFGEFDSDIPLAKVEPLVGKWLQATIHIYPARHGFSSDRRIDYHAPSADLARKRTLDFFDSRAAYLHD